jgi:hypothetical protein
MYEITWHHPLLRAMAEGLAAFLNGLGHAAAARHGRSYPTRRGPVRLYSGIHVRHAGEARYALIDLRDSVSASANPVVREAVFDDDCRLVLKGQYRACLYQGPPLTKVRPYTYFECRPRLFQRLLRRLRRAAKGHDRLYFRGRDYGPRGRIVARLADLLGPTPADLAARDYYLDLAPARVGLSLPGQGEVCYREIEYFGAGVVAVRPRLRNSFHDPLVPGTHYIAVEARPRRDGRNAAEVADAVRAAYERHRGDHEFLARVARNAMAWYDRNVWLPNSVPLTARLLGLPVAP